MTKQQKREAQLQKEIRRLERNNIVLQKENDELKYDIKVLTLQNRNLNKDLVVANRQVTESETRVKNMLAEVHKYATTDVFTYLKGLNN